MKALQLEKPPGEQKKGARNIAAVREVPVPKPGKGQVLVKVSIEQYRYGLACDVTKSLVERPSHFRPRRSRRPVSTTVTNGQ